MSQVGADIKQDQYDEGLTKHRGKRANHKSTRTLLEVPRYSDLLDDQDDEDKAERGRLLVNTAEGWRTVMAKWITASRAAEAADDAEAALMQALAELEEDERLDDGEVEIASEDEYNGQILG